MRLNWPTFDESMALSKKYWEERTEDKNWDIIKDRYNIIREKPIHKCKIPKIVHQIWLGGKIREKEEKMCNEIKISLPSDWQYKLWTDDNIKDLINFKNYKEFQNTPCNGQRSDLLRYQILHDFGGVYMDTDFLPVGSFDSLMDLDFFTGVAFDGYPSIFNGLIGSSPGNILTDALLNLDMPISYGQTGSTSMEVITTTGPYFLTRKLYKTIKALPNLAVMPTSFFYPFPSNEYQNVHNYKTYFRPETICCHMWSGSW